VRRSSVAKRYAQALFQAAVDKKLLDVIESDFDQMVKEFQEVEGFRKLIDSPVISNQNKIDVVTRVFKDRISEILFNFLLLLIRKNRENLLPEIHIYFKEYLDEYRGIVRGTVHAAVPLSETQMQELKKFLDRKTGKNVILVQKTDENLIGGFVIQIKDIVIDSSIRGQLSRLKEQLAGSV